MILPWRRGAWLLALVALALGAPGASGQLVFGAHVARAPDLFGGADGFGLRAGLELGPVGVTAVGDWYGVDCPPDVGDCHYRSGTLLGTVEVPAPLIRPYLLAGLGIRDLAPGPGASVRTTVAGFGLRVGLGPAGVFTEVAGELPRQGPAQLVLRVGARF